ncbi:MAG: radical SAM/SPASM domain-containing protein [Candidatus Micrarchaeia archaeon]
MYTYKTNKNLDFSRGVEVAKNNKYEFFDSSEIKFLKSKILRSDILSAPTTVDLYPTLFCNERCKFCYIGNRLDNKINGLSRKNAISIMNELVENGIFSLSILGGEPLLYRDLGWLLDIAYKRDLIISISSNGTMYNENLINKIVEYDISFSLSFHSHLPKIHADIVNNNVALNKELNFLDRVINKGLKTHVTTLITKNNKDSVLETIKFLCDNGIKAITLFHWSKSDFGSINQKDGIDFWDFKEILKKAMIIGKKYNVKITSRTNFPFLIYEDMDLEYDKNLSNILYGTIDTRRVLHILYDGSTYSTTYDLPHNKAFLGNVFQEGISKLWNNNKNLEMLRNASIPNVCKKCEHFDYCRTGSVLNYKENINNDLPLCPLHIKPLFAE